MACYDAINFHGAPGAKRDPYSTPPHNEAQNSVTSQNVWQPACFPILRRWTGKRSMPLVSTLLAKDGFKTLDVREDGVKDLGSHLLFGFLNGGISLILVLLGGFFAGLTLAYGYSHYYFWYLEN
jgi:hypothetical protein